MSNPKPVRNVGNDLTPATNIIDKMGLGGEVLRLAKAGMTQQEIAKQMNLHIGLINEWLKRHQQLPEEARRSVAERNIFQVADRLQENFTEVYRLLEDARAAGDRESWAKAVAEVRQHLRFVGEIVEKLETIKNQQKMQEAFLDWLDEQSPGAKVAIIRKMQESRGYFSILSPL